jgi:DNA-binding PadR family transcriptional regulator
MISIQRAVREFGLRPGFDLVDVKKCGLPVFRLTVEAITLRRQNLPTIQEFILKSLTIEDATASVIAAMLGLAVRHVEENLTRLMFEQLVSETTDPLKKIRYRLTDFGKERLESGQNRPQDETLVFDYDLLFQSPVKLTDAQVESAKEARQDGTILLPPATLDPPVLQTLSFNTLVQTVRRIGGKEFQKQILGLRRILRHQMMFRPATGLLFRNRLSGDLELGLVVDDKLSERHEIEFSRTGGLKKAGFIKGSWSEDTSRIRTLLGASAWAKVEDDQAEAVQLRLRGLARERTDLVEMHERKHRSRDKLKGHHLQTVEDLDRQIVATKAQLDGLPLRSVSPSELRILIRDALEHTESELIFSIDAVEQEGMSRQVVGQLGKLAERAAVEIRTNDPIDAMPIGEKGKFEPGVQLWSLANINRRLTLSERGSELHGLSIVVRDRKLAIIAAGPILELADRRPHFRVQTAYLTSDLDIIELVRQTLGNGAPVVV